MVFRQGFLPLRVAEHQPAHCQLFHLPQGHHLGQYPGQHLGLHLGRRQTPQQVSMLLFGRTGRLQHLIRMQGQIQRQRWVQHHLLKALIRLMGSVPPQPRRRLMCRSLQLHLQRSKVKRRSSASHLQQVLVQFQKLPMGLLVILRLHWDQHHLLQALIRTKMDLALHHQRLKVMKRSWVPLRQKLIQIQIQKRDRSLHPPKRRVKPKSSELVPQLVQTRRKNQVRHQPRRGVMERNSALRLL